MEWLSCGFVELCNYVVVGLWMCGIVVSWNC